MPGANIFYGGEDFAFLISDKKKLTLLQDSKSLWDGSLSGDEGDIWLLPYWIGRYLKVIDAPAEK